MNKLTANERMKKVRESLGLNQKDFAFKLGFKASYYSELERGKKEITARVLSTLIETFQVSSDWILSGIDENNQTLRKGENFNKLGTSNENARISENASEKLDLTKGENSSSSAERRKTELLEQLKVVMNTEPIDQEKFNSIMDEISQNIPPLSLKIKSQEEVRSFEQKKEMMLEEMDKRHKFGLRFIKYLEVREPELFDLQATTVNLSILIDTLSDVCETYFNKVTKDSYHMDEDRSTYTYEDYKNLRVKELEEIKPFLNLIKALEPALHNFLRESKEFDPLEIIPEWIVDMELE